MILEQEGARKISSDTFECAAKRIDFRGRELKNLVRENGKEAILDVATCWSGSWSKVYGDFTEHLEEPFWRYLVANCNC